MKKTLRILMVAAENDGLPNCKVGGIGDVVRDAPPALARLGCEISIVTPSYGFLHKQKNGTMLAGSVMIRFGDRHLKSQVFKVPGRKNYGNKVNHFVIDHPEIFRPLKLNEGFQIYSHDANENPFATDATKFAFFCRATAEAVKSNLFGAIDCIHLHDWHASFFLIFRQYHKGYRLLKKIKTVYTIHNLSIQGVRPFKGPESSLESWYRDFDIPKKNVLADPRWPDCLNPMAIGIRLSDKVQIVSPSYAAEIIRPSDKPRYYGGDGLEKDLTAAAKDDRLIGILNGCEYPAERDIAQFKSNELLNYLKASVLKWASGHRTLSSVHFLAYTRLSEISTRRTGKSIILTSVSRVVEQKLYLMKARGSAYPSALQGILEGIRGQGIYILLGTGDKEYEKFLTEMSCKFENFIFLNAYSDSCAKALYASGHLFLMPSSYEPCGISQMLAMRDGQPCVVHEVGGLKDTVKNNRNGFTFCGSAIEEQVDNFVRCCLGALKIKMGKPTQWNKICKEASKARFLWDDSVKEYITKLYRDAPFD